MSFYIPFNLVFSRVLIYRCIIFVLVLSLYLATKPLIQHVNKVSELLAHQNPNYVYHQ